MLPEPILYVPAGRDVAVIGRLKGQARRTGRDIDVSVAQIWSVRDGKIRRLVTFIDTPAMRLAIA